MPENKRRPPGRLSKEVDELAEAALRYYFEEMIPVAEWDSSEGLWHLLTAPDPSTQNRVLAHALDLVVSGQHKLPARLAEAIKAHLIKPTSRNRIKNIEGMKKAARFQAENPKALQREIGRAVDIDHTVIGKWQKQFAYKREYHFQLIKVAGEVYKSYIERFGSPFAAARLPEPRPYGLARIRGAIDKAMADGTPITDRAVLEWALHDPLARGGD